MNLEDCDIFGLAVKDYLKKTMHFGNIRVFSNITGSEKIKLSYLFRKYKNMPEIEKIALENCSGKILDVGACAGSHSLFLQNHGYDVTALDISPGCCEVLEFRGVKKVVNKDIFQFSGQKFDTLLFIMNGIGVAGTLSGLEQLLAHCKNLLSDNGKIIFESTDIDYVFQEEDGSKWIDLNSNYYGEVCYSMQYKKYTGKKFNWLFIDPLKMEEISKEFGYSFKIIKEGVFCNYLGELRLV